MGILHGFVDQARHPTRRIHAVLTGSNGATKLTRAVVPEKPSGELAPHAPYAYGDGSHFPGLALVQRDKAGRVENELRCVSNRAAHNQRQIGLRDSAQERMMHHPMKELRRHARGIRRNLGLEPANGGQEGIDIEGVGGGSAVLAAPHFCWTRATVAASADATP
eukprot:5354594-Amphidinium_carterae.1